ncbi:MAG: 3-deoxy-D-manno-octulosonic acid transferase, partial [Flavisolibacter sp.]
MTIPAWLYTAFIRIYVFGIRIAATRNAKAKEWIQGRKRMWNELSGTISATDRTIWFHCASAGELEQGKPLIEAIKTSFPEHKIVISFFSPSGYKAGLKYKSADVITWIPADTPANAKRFIKAVHPELAVFIKYEYWYHHLTAAAFRHIPILLASAIFRKEQVFFKWYGKFFRQMLFLFRQLFVQDEASKTLLADHAIAHASISGDTRFDRVKKIAGMHQPVPEIIAFAGNKPLIVAGSTWPEDEDMLAACFSDHESKMLIIPHEINQSHLDQIIKKFPGAKLFSQYRTEGGADSRVLVIDGYGLLSRLYYYADI